MKKEVLTEISKNLISDFEISRKHPAGIKISSEDYQRFVIEIGWNRPDPYVIPHVLFDGCIVGVFQDKGLRSGQIIIEH